MTAKKQDNRQNMRLDAFGKPTRAALEEFYQHCKENKLDAIDRSLEWNERFGCEQ